MIIDFQYFSYGTGLVMLGWVCGMIFRTVVRVIKTGSEAI